MKVKTRRLFNRKYSRIIVLVTFDILSVVAASFLAIWIRFDFQQIPIDFIQSINHYLPIDCAILIVVFAIAGLYTSIWRYGSIPELLTIAGSCALVDVIIFTYKHTLSLPLPRSFWFIFLAFLIFFTCGVRFSYRIGRVFLHVLSGKKRFKNTMIIGGGEAASRLIDEMNHNAQYQDTRICCIIDDDKQKKGVRMRGVPIVGNCTQVQPMAEKYRIEQIIIAIPSASKEKISKIIYECQKAKCEIKILPSVYLMSDKKTEDIVAQIRPIKYEDFLGRDQIVVNNDEITDNIVGKVVLVTGGGGSIGSELCRQIAKAKPQLLIIFDIYENNAYEIQQELYRTYPKLNLEVIVGSVRDYERLEKVFEEFHPSQVYHAAAHKHVPLMERSPNEAIKNNCLGTLNTVKLADKYGVKKFVLVSTDKAVRPTNIMGASKRICEMIIQTYNKKSKTDYVAVRFGNVLGSNGSVIPLFLKQIEEGGPVTVTHKDITRYFMTIPEAVSLILQAGVYAEGGGDICVGYGQTCSDI